MSVPLPSLAEPVRFGVYTVDLRAGELRKYEQRVKLQERPFQILCILLERPGEVVTRDELCSRLWPDGTFVDFDHSISSAIKKLRDALSDSAATPRYVETVGRRGYRFIYPIDRRLPLNVVSIDAAGETSETDDSRSELSIAPARTNPGLLSDASVTAFEPPWWRKATVVAGTLIALIMLGAWVVAGRGTRGQAIDSIAVLPFVNGSGEPNSDYLSDGIAEIVINNLSQLHNLRVIARSTVFRYKGKDPDPQKIGHDLGVQAVLLGRLLQHGDSLVVQAELVDVSNGSQLWGGEYSRKSADVFALQEDLSSEISESLRLRLTGDEKRRLTKRYTESTEAYRFYLKGRYFFNQWSPEQSKKAIEYFEQAINKDPRYALAYAGLADTYISRAWFGEDRPREAVPKAKLAALKALELDDGIAEAHVSLGFVDFLYDWDWSAAGKHFERALELNPAYANGHAWYSLYLAALGRSNEALAEAKRAVDLDPASPGMTQLLAIQLTCARRFDDAIAEYRNALEMGYHDAHMGLGTAYLDKGMYREALAQFEQFGVVDLRTPRVISSIGYAHAQLNDRKEALRAIGELREMSKHRYVSPGSVAFVYLGLGEKEQTFAWLNKAYEEHSFALAFLKIRPEFDSLRDDPRFVDLLRRIGLAP